MKTNLNQLEIEREALEGKVCELEKKLSDLERFKQSYARIQQLRCEWMWTKVAEEEEVIFLDNPKIFSFDEL